tara:strand:- start:9652 stop:10797 length:1146 start_codon:yes stop_codon:yes gene_type:complete
MIKVGFIGNISVEWMGGFNYLKNLLFALDKLDIADVEIFVFIGKKTDTKVKNMFKKYATVIEDSLFDRKSLKWFFSKIEKKIFKTNSLLENILKKHAVQILSHSFITKFKNIRTINWIPDFQHIHLPEMFSQKEINERNKSFMCIIKNSDAVVVSSNDAMNDLNKFAPGYKHKTKVLKFVSQPHKIYSRVNDNDKDKLLKKYNLNDDFFYMPNQFWKHKNHITVFKAIAQLKNEGVDVSLACTGHLADYRNQDYFNDIKKFIQDNNLNENIKILGVVDIEDVYRLIKISKAVINPSLFEGWSSTVEECKSVGKNMILSDINVHREQYPNATFFDRNNIESLKKSLKECKSENQEKNIESLEIRTKRYANVYFDILKEMINP